MADLQALLADLAAEGQELDDVVAPLPAPGWDSPTPAEGWTVATQIAHLAWTDEVALDAATDEAAFRQRLAAATQDPLNHVDEAAHELGARPPAEILEHWRAGRHRLHAALQAVEPGRKVPWFGPPMSVASLATARLMETWAHGQDVADTLGWHRAPTARLRHVAHIGIRTRDFAFLLHDLQPPPEPFRVELTGPDGDEWTWGPADATDRVTGPALDFCLLVTQRRNRDDLSVGATGGDAVRWLGIAQAFAGLPGKAAPVPESTAVQPPIRIANASGFYGDRSSALSEMLTGGEIDVLTGDYLAELTMLILARDRLKDPGRGYARTFLRQLEGTLGPALDLGVRIVTNAGGLNPAALASEIRSLARRLGLDVNVAHVEGDDLLPRAAELGLGSPLAANAYLGAFGIAAGLSAGADIVVTGRVTDASLVVGPAVARFGWQPGDLDRLAGAVVAGHVIECGPQATGGNYAFFAREQVLTPAAPHPGFPIAEVHDDGTSVITKHAGTGGAVTVGTVTAQLLYEIGGPRYLGPDVTARFDTVRLEPDGPDRVRISGTVGEPPPGTLKVGLNTLGGFRNEVVFVLTGLDVEAKAALVRAQLTARVDADLAWTLARTDRADAATEQEASALLHCVVRGTDPKTVGRAFSGAAIELALASYPGFHVTAPPSDATPYGVFTSVEQPAHVVPHRVVLQSGEVQEVVHPDPRSPGLVVHRDSGKGSSRTTKPEREGSERATKSMPLGEVVGARSGDKGGAANIGVWVVADDAYDWLDRFLTVDRLRELLPETAGLEVTRHDLPNLRALSFVVEGILGEGVSSNARFDPQAKALGEWLRSRLVDIPAELLA